MSEPKLLMYNNKQELIAWSKFGVLWGATRKERLGEFTESQVFNNQRQLVAKLVGESVLNSKNEIIGCLSVFEHGRFLGHEPYSFELFIDDKKVGLCNYGKSMAAAVLVLLRQELIDDE